MFLVFDNLSLWTGTSHFGKLRTEIGLGPRLQTLACQLTFHLFRMQGEADCKGSSVGGRCEED